MADGSVVEAAGGAIAGNESGALDCGFTDAKEVAGSCGEA